MSAKNPATWAAVALVVLCAGSANAQTKATPETKTIQGEPKTMTVTVINVDKANRQATVRKPDGNYQVIYAPAALKAFETLKVNDKITAKYYENIVIQSKSPDDKKVNAGAEKLVQVEGAPPGTMSRQRTLTVTISAIDREKSWITFLGPSGYKYDGPVKDPAALANKKVGDKLDITWVVAAAISIEPAK